MSEEKLATLEAKVAERFRADPSLTSGAARWAVLSETTPVERDAYLAVLALTYELHPGGDSKGDEPPAEESQT